MLALAPLNLAQAFSYHRLFFCQFGDGHQSPPANLLKLNLGCPKHTANGASIQTQCPG
jgi:hypothetical protein